MHVTIFPEEIMVLHFRFFVLFCFYELGDYLPTVTTLITQKAIQHLLTG